jgi:hypothetical protein
MDRIKLSHLSSQKSLSCTHNPQPFVVPRNAQPLVVPRNTQPFTLPEISLTFPQAPVTGPSAEAHKSHPQRKTLLLLPFQYYPSLYVNLSSIVRGFNYNCVRNHLCHACYFPCEFHIPYFRYHNNIW